MDALIVLGSLVLVLFVISFFSNKEREKKERELELLNESEAIWRAGERRRLLTFDRDFFEVRVTGTFPIYWKKHVYNPEHFFLHPVGYGNKIWDLYSTNINKYPLVRTGKEKEYGVARSRFMTEEDAIDAAINLYAHYMKRGPNY